VIARATGREAERRFVVRAVRIDSTVVEADIRHPTDLGRAGDATRMLTGEIAVIARQQRCSPEKSVTAHFHPPLRLTVGTSEVVSRP